MLKDIDFKYKSGALTTTKNVTLSGSGASLSVGGSVRAASGLYSNSIELVGVQPTDIGLEAWSFDPGAALLTGQAVTSGTVYLSALYIRSTTSVSNIWLVMSNSQSVTAGANWVGLYNSSGTKLVDAATDSVVNTSGVKTVPITTQNLSPGMYWVAVLIGFPGTAPQIAAAATNGTSRPVVNGALTASSYRWCTNGTGQTTLSSSITPASNSLTGILAPWVGLS